MALFVVACKAEFTPGIADSEVIPAGVQGVVAWQAADLAVHEDHLPIEHLHVLE